jgi:hypothetical protein
MSPDNAGTRVFLMLHHLMPVMRFSGKVLAMGRIFKESIKVCTPNSPPSAGDPPL